MSETKLSPKKQLHSMLYEAGIFQAFPCSSEENEQYAKMLANNEPLPAGVYRYRNQNGDDTDQFYTSNKDELTDAERLQMIELQKKAIEKEQLAAVITIKKCVIFFTVLAVISLAAGLVSALVLACR